MLEIADRLLLRLDAGRPVVVATVVHLDGSGPRTVGTSMAWDGESVVGSLAGGCVEGAVVDVAERVLDDARARTIELGVDPDEPFAAGLACGGRLRVHLALVRPGDRVVDALRDAAADRAAGVALPLTGGGAPPFGTGPSPAVAARLEAAVAARVALGRPGLVTVECDGERVEAFVDVAVPPARMVVVGAMELSSALAAAATALGYAVTVVDPRPLFATPERFPGVDLVVDWPPRYLAAAGIDDRTVVCLLSHDDRFDADALAVALRSPAAFVGALGSRRTHARRVEALRTLGLTDDELARLHSPVGLDIGASTPQETAVSILAEVVAVRTGAHGGALRDRQGPIHRSVPTPEGRDTGAGRQVPAVGLR